MMTKTVPRLEFDRYFTTQRLADLRKTYGWDDSFNEERSVVYSHSGLINGNPFVICRTRKMEMGTKHTMVIRQFIGRKPKPMIKETDEECNAQRLSMQQ